MAILLGIDTGGTYTDAVLFEEGVTDPVRAKAKALTTRHDLSIGISEAISAVLTAAAIPAAEIALASISTTLATNALVEGQGGHVALVFIGFDTADEARAGLAAALGTDPILRISGGHTPSGDEFAPLDLAALEQGITEISSGVEAVAIVSRFGTRNTAHERAARDLIRARTGLPVTCGHELSARLNGPKRALTCVLNARLVGMISELIDATETTLGAHAIDAPLMLVRGDGALISAAVARDRPIETILSGPAASLVGAAALTGLQDAIVSDIGGTTTDIAILEGGRPRISPEGATVGGFTTMVEAVDMGTHGLGGDSEVSLVDGGLVMHIMLGPRRAIPVSLLALSHPDIVLTALERQLNALAPGEHDTRFALRRPGTEQFTRRLPAADLALLQALGTDPKPLDHLLSSRAHGAILKRLVARGLVRMSCFTPSDAAHVLNIHSGWNRLAAELAARLLARRRDGRGQPIAPGAEGFSQLTIDQLARRSCELLLSASLQADHISAPNPATDPLIAAAFAKNHSHTRIDIGLALPLIGLGASAPTYYPAIADRLGTASHIPTHADVANAIGAVAGRVSVRREITLSRTPEGAYRLHLPDRIELAPNLDAARAAASAVVKTLASDDATSAGADAPRVTLSFDERSATIEGQLVVIECIVSATAQGRPRLARN